MMPEIVAPHRIVPSQQVGAVGGKLLAEEAVSAAEHAVVVEVEGGLPVGAIVLIPDSRIIHDAEFVFEGGGEVHIRAEVDDGVGLGGFDRVDHLFVALGKGLARPVAGVIDAQNNVDLAVLLGSETGFERHLGSGILKCRGLFFHEELGAVAPVAEEVGGQIPVVEHERAS